MLYKILLLVWYGCIYTKYVSERFLVKINHELHVGNLLACKLSLKETNLYYRNNKIRQCFI